MSINVLPTFVSAKQLRQRDLSKALCSYFVVEEEWLHIGQCGRWVAKLAVSLKAIRTGLGVLGFQPWGGIVGRMEGLLQADRAGCCLRPTSWSQELPPPPQPDTSASIQGAFAHLESQALKMSCPASFGRVLPGPVRHKLSTAFKPSQRTTTASPTTPLCSPTPQARPANLMAYF